VTQILFKVKQTGCFALRQSKLEHQLFIICENNPLKMQHLPQSNTDKLQVTMESLAYTF